MISVICPTFNERDYISGVIDFFLRVEPSEKELLIVDGGSVDGTREIVKRYQEKNSNVRLIDNPDRFVPYALNAGIKASKGDPIICIGAHSEFADDYFVKILETFSTVDADIVGGPTRTRAKEPKQQAIASAISCIFGTGDSKVHDENYRGYSDHVTFGAWKRSLFDDVGYFDEELIRDQDDEFHYRAKSKGKKLFLNPDIKLYYYPRSSFVSLFKQYYQYGFFKPLVFKKVASEIKFRHIAPALFVVYLAASPLSIVFPLLVIPLALYLILLLYFSVSKGKSIIERLYLLITFPVIHTGYGSGILMHYVGYSSHDAKKNTQGSR